MMIKMVTKMPDWANRPGPAIQVHDKALTTVFPRSKRGRTPCVDTLPGFFAPGMIIAVAAGGGWSVLEGDPDHLTA